MSYKNQLDHCLRHCTYLAETDYRNLPEEMADLVEVGMGGAALKDLLDNVDLDELIESLPKKLKKLKVSERRR